MKLLTVVLMLAVFIAVSATISGTVSAHPLVYPMDRGCNTSARPFILAQTDYGGEFDLNYCQYECRMRYGVEPSGTGGALSNEGGNPENELHQSTPNYVQYAGCIADCKRTFWRQFENKKPWTGRDIQSSDQFSC